MSCMIIKDSSFFCVCVCVCVCEKMRHSHSVCVCVSGLGKNVFPRFEGLVRRLSLLYFRVFKKQTVDYFNAAIKVFWNSPLTSPALVFYCENDMLSDPEDLEELITCWQSRGITVEKQKWKESIHAAHLRAHPQEYLSALDSFMQSISIVPLKAKM